MIHDQFVYWLQGFVEMNGGKAPTKQQWQIIKDHLKLCFNKVTPHYPPINIEQYRQFDPNKPVDIGTAPVNPTWPPYKITCGNVYPNNYGLIGAYVNGQGQFDTLAAQARPNGGGGGC